MEDRMKQQLTEQIESLRKELAELKQGKTERKRAEEALKIFKFMVESAHDAIFFKDLDSRYIIANAKALDAFGLSREEVIGKTDYELMTNQAEAKKNIEDDQVVFKTKTPADITKHMTATNGVKHWFQAIKVPQFDESGNIMGLVGIARDVTERKRAEEALRESEERYRTLFESKLDGVCIIDETMKLLLANQATATIFGFDSVEEMLDVNPFQYIPTQERERLLTIVTKDMFQDNLQQVNEFQVKKKDGEKIWISAVGTPTEYQGKTAGLVSIHDITERKRVEETLRQSEERYRMTFENTGTAMAVLEEDTTISLVNSQFEKLTKYSRKEIEGKMSWIKFVHRDDLQRMIEYHKKRRGKSDEVPKEYEFRAMDKNGEVRYALLNVDMIPGTKKSLISAIDTTERKKAEERIEHLSLVLRAIRNVNQLITKEKDREKLLKGACDNLTGTRGYYNAWIALLDESGKLVAHAESGLGKSFLPMVERLKRGQLTTCGQRALKQQEAVVTEDPGFTCTDCPLSSSYAGRSAATARLEYGGKVYGLLSVSILGEMATDVEELGLFREVATDIAFGLYDIELEEKRKQAEEALRESEEFNSSLLSNSPNPIVVINPDTSVRYVNPALEELTGFSSLELVGVKAPYPWWTEETLQKTSEDFGEALHKGAQKIEELFQNKDGQQFRVEISSTPIMRNGELEYYIASWVDITERKRAEEERLAATRRAEETMESMIDGVIIVDFNGVTLETNSAFEKQTGYKKKEVIGKTVRELGIVPVEDFAKRFEQMPEMLKKGYLQNVEEIVTRKDGTKFNALHNFTILRDAKGNPMGLIVVTRDITEHKQVQEKLKESEQRYRQLFQTSPDYIAQIDKEGRFLTTNPAMAKSFGIPVEELIGKTLFEMMPQEVAQPRLGMITKTLNERQSQIFEDEKQGRHFHNIFVPMEIPGQEETVQVIASDITERKQAEEALRDGEEFNSSLLSNSPNPIIVINPDTSVRYVDPALEKLTGFTSAELIGTKAPYPWWTEKTLQKTSEDLREGMHKGIQKVEELFQNKDGKRFWVEISATAIKQNGELKYYISNWVDITERKRAEEELWIAKEEYRDLYEKAPLGYHTVDPEGRIASMNELELHWLGYTWEELENKKTIFDIQTEESAKRGRKFFQRLVTKGGTMDAELEFVRKDGTVMPALLHASSLHDREGKFIRTRSIVIDITERKRAEEEIKYQRKYFQALFESSPEAVVSLDMQIRVMDINPAFKKLFGYTLEDIEGKDILDYILPKGKQEEASSIIRMAKSGKVVTAESIRKRADGGEIPVSILSAPIIFDGKPIGIFGIYRDITEHKRAEEQLERSFTDLAETVSRAMSSRDPYTADHQHRVAELARLVGEKMGLDKYRLKGLHIGALLHDIGKISIPGSILSKPGKLTEEEWALIRAHAKQGYEILNGGRFPWPVADMALCHHERLDGSGYPHGISGDKLSLEVRILGVCDVVEAMSSHRPYRPARSKEEVLGEIKSGRGTKYDADVVDIMLQIIESGEFKLK